MNIESLTNNDTGITHVKNNKRYKLGFLFIPKSELVSFDKAYAYVLESFDIDTSHYAEQTDTYLINHNLPKVNPLPPEEQAKRLSIRNKALKNLLESHFDYIRFFDHQTKDSSGFRYTAKNFMHYTADKEADLVHNQKLSYLLEMAGQQKYADNKELDEKTKKEKEDLVKYYRDRAKSVENYDLEAFTSKEWSDEDLAEHAHEIFDLANILTEYNNYPLDLQKFGIKDQECEDTINKYNHYGEYFMMLQTRLSTIVSPSYHLYDPKKETGMFKEMSDGELMTDKKYTDCMDSYIANRQTTFNSQLKTIQGIFSELGVPADQVFIADPKQQSGKNYVNNAIYVIKENGDLTFVSDNPKYSMTFNMKNEDFSKARAQNRLSELIEQSMVSDPAPVEEPNEVARPQEVSFLGKVADFFTNMFTHHKPRQEAYNRSMTEYNQYQNHLELYNEYVKGHTEFLAKEHENEAKARLAAALNKREQADRENLRQLKLAKQIKKQEIGIIKNINNNNIVIKNNEVAKNLIAKEFTDNNHPIEEKKVPENNIKEIRAKRAQKIVDRMKKQISLYDKYLNDGIEKSTLSPFERVIMSLLDISGTPEAEQNNLKMLHDIQTPEGKAEYLKKGLNLVFNLDLRKMLSTDPDELLEYAEENWGALCFAFDPSFETHSEDIDPEMDKIFSKCRGVFQEAGLVRDIITAMTTEEYKKGTFDNMTRQEFLNYTYQRPEVYIKKDPNLGNKSRMQFIQGLGFLADRKDRYVGCEQRLNDAGFTGRTIKDFANMKYTNSEGVERTPSQVIDDIINGVKITGESKTKAEKDKLDELLNFPAKDKSIYNNAQPQI